MGVILVGFIAGIAGTILVLNMAGISITNVSGSSTKTTTSSVSYSNSNDTTKAVEKFKTQLYLLLTTNQTRRLLQVTSTIKCLAMIQTVVAIQALQMI